MKLLRIWVPDPSSPEFAAEAKRQASFYAGGGRGRRDPFAEAGFAENMIDEPDYDWSKL